ncbi:MAG: hypothetical protein HYY84_01010 [Deltaproteobacteria bacterium]|nr:hypothetical protein [Deltaproteobacteria bacterium]
MTLGRIIPWAVSAVLAVVASFAIGFHWSDPMVTRECGWLGDVGRALIDDIFDVKFVKDTLCPASWGIEAPALGLFIFTGGVLALVRRPPAWMRVFAVVTAIVASALVTDKLSSQYATETANCHIIVLFIAMAFGIAEGKRAQI